MIDTNLYLYANRDPAKAEELERFSSAFMPQLYFHAVVLFELRSGALTKRRARELERWWAAPAAKRNRLVAPRYATWQRAGEIVAALVERKQLQPGQVKPSFVHDILIAVSCRQEGVTVITANRRDFELISSLEPVTFVPPWPSS